MVGKKKTKAERVQRFSMYRIAEHWALILCFAILLVTGLAQKFHAMTLSQWVIIQLGGITYTRFIHHVAGVVLLLLAATHIFVFTAGMALRRLGPDMLITLKDFADAVHNIKYYLGVVDRPAEGGRYSYKQKMVYWFVFLGSIQMIATGLVLWYPVIAAQYFPGQVVPVAKAMHSNEAMLLFLIVVLWHIYDSIFNPSIFPLDKSIFTGYIHVGEPERGNENPPAREYARGDSETREGEAQGQG